MAYRTRTTKAQRTAQHLFWAFDWERRAREALALSMEKEFTEEGMKAWKDCQNFAKWRDDEMVKATGMNWQEYHNYAFGKKAFED